MPGSYYCHIHRRYFSSHCLGCAHDAEIREQRRDDEIVAAARDLRTHVMGTPGFRQAFDRLLRALRAVDGENCAGPEIGNCRGERR